MNEFQGLCPICYLPVKADDDSRTLVAEGDRQEIYHANCLHDYVKQNKTTDADTPSAALSILEQHKKLIIGDNTEKRKQWALSQTEEWQHHGAYLKALRESFFMTLSETAKQLCISPARLKRLENGEPVRDAMLLRRAYYILMSYIALHQQYRNYEALTETVYGINQTYLEQMLAQGEDGE